MKRTHTADDGTTFETRAECKEYEERGKLINALSNLEELHVGAALIRADGALLLADAIERAGNIIAAKRRANGEMKRGKNGSIENVAKAMEDQQKANK